MELPRFAGQKTWHGRWRALYIALFHRPTGVLILKRWMQEKIHYEPVAIDFVRSYVPVPDTDEASVKEAAELDKQAERP